MAKSVFRIKPYKHPRLKWVVRSKLSGKWKRKFFETEKTAKTYVELKEIELLNQGREGATFSTALRVMAQRENDRLEKFGKTITDATDFYIRHLEATAKSVPFTVAMDGLIANRRANGATERYCYDLKMRLRRFAGAHTNRNVSEFTTADIDKWLGALALGPVTRNIFRRDLRTLFSFAMTRKWCAENPVIASSEAKEIDSEVQIFLVPEIKRLLENASDEMLPVWAIGAFAGLRHAEIKRLEWGQVDFKARLIEVKAKHSKTGARRLVTIQPNLRAWLAPYRGSTGRVYPKNVRKIATADRTKAKITKWPVNVLRHSFGSYHLARFKDTAALALQMGNSPKVIFKHYRQLVRPAEARKYWSLKPSADAAAKVVSISAKAA